MPNPDWQNRLEPFAEIYSEAEGKMRQIVEAMDEEEVKALLDAAEQVTLTNSPFPIIQAIGPVRSIVSYELGRRRFLAEEPDEPGGTMAEALLDAEGQHTPGLGTFPYHDLVESGGPSLDRFIEITTAKKGLNAERLVSLLTQNYGFDPRRQAVMLSRGIAGRIGLNIEEEGAPIGGGAGMSGALVGGVFVSAYLAGMRVIVVELEPSGQLLSVGGIGGERFDENQSAGG